MRDRAPSPGTPGRVGAGVFLRPRCEKPPRTLPGGPASPQPWKTSPSSRTPCTSRSTRICSTSLQRETLLQKLRPPSRLGRRRIRRPAFTLIEAVAALFLMGVALPVIMSSVSVSTRASGMARRQAEAGELAESKLNELVSTGLSQSTLQGDFGA